MDPNVWITMLIISNITTLLIAINTGYQAHRKKPVYVEKHTLLGTFVGINAVGFQAHGYHCSCGKRPIMILGGDLFEKTTEEDAIEGWKNHNKLWQDVYRVSREREEESI